MDLLTFAEEYRRTRRDGGVALKTPVAVCVIDVHGNVVAHSPHERRAGLLDRALRAEGLHVGSGGDANRRHPSDCAAWAAAFPAHVTSPALRHGRWAPLTREGQVIAGVGVSGGTVEQDVAILEAESEKPSSRP